MRQDRLWWRGDPAGRHWLESTDRPDIGASLKAPLADASGRSNWPCILFYETKIDDIVFHYDVCRGAIIELVAGSRVAAVLSSLSPCGGKAV